MSEPRGWVQQVTTLRNRSGFGLIECKRALEYSGWNTEAAEDYLRTTGTSIFRPTRLVSRDEAERKLTDERLRQLRQTAWPVGVQSERTTLKAMRQSLLAALFDERAAEERADGVTRDATRDWPKDAIKAADKLIGDL